METVKTYYRLTKPGIIYGNLLTTAAGFLYASAWKFSIVTLLATLAGTATVIGGACVVNNVIDRDIDAKMERTRRRAIVSGAVKPTPAIFYASALIAIGFLLLSLYTNLITVLLGFIGVVDYIVFYGWAKRHTIHSTLIGSISGSVPIAAGYTAVTGKFDIDALILFLIMTFWQMAHFYAIALYRKEQYSNAGLPIISTLKSFDAVRFQTIIYAGLFIIACFGLAILGKANWFYAALVLAFGVWWFNSIFITSIVDHSIWGKKVFLHSLTVVSILSISIASATITG